MDLVLDMLDYKWNERTQECSQYLPKSSCDFYSFLCLSVRNLVCLPWQHWSLIVQSVVVPNCTGHKFYFHFHLSWIFFHSLNSPHLFIICCVSIFWWCELWRISFMNKKNCSLSLAFYFLKKKFFFFLVLISLLLTNLFFYDFRILHYGKLHLLG